MLIQGKHAQIKIYEEKIRILKTYKDPQYVDNEFSALDFLAKVGIMNLNPKIESTNTISLDWINEGDIPELKTNKQKELFIYDLVKYLKELHKLSYDYYGFYVTHEDIFLDNLLICKNTGKLFFIDWGLSKKRNNVYPDIASSVLGVFNDYPELFTSFLKEYFEISSKIDFSQIEMYVNQLYQEYYNIRVSNSFCTDTLDARLLKAKELLKSSSLSIK